MTADKKTSVYLSDRMVLVGLGLGIVYWIVETLLYVFLSYELRFFDRFFGPDLAGICTRVIVLCLFLIFGSHVQYTLNQRKKTDAELARLKETNLALQQQLDVPFRVLEDLHDLKEEISNILGVNEINLMVDKPYSRWPLNMISELIIENL